MLPTRMIQRIQTIHLALALVTLLALFFFDAIWQAEGLESPYAFLPTAAAILALGTALVVVVSIFLYGNRKKQRKAVVTAQVMTLLLLFVLVAVVYVLGLGAAGSLAVLWPMVLPIATYALLVLARRGIDKDIALVKSMDRLR